MATIHNPNNWHWMNKNCLPWAKDYFNTNLIPVTHTLGSKILKIKEIKTVSGDCEVTQRKGKVRCIFEMKVEFVVIIEDEDSNEEIIITLPEFEHDYEIDDFNFQINSNNINNKSIVRKEFLPVVIEKVFLKFQPDLLSTHEEMLKHNTD